MSSYSAPRCRHIKVNGIQCGSPALRNQSFCFYHQEHRSLVAECYSGGTYATGEVTLPPFEDAYSVQSVIRQVVQMVLQQRIERKTASLLLYALQIASSNLKRMELEKPQPEQVVTNTVTEPQSASPIAALEPVLELALETRTELPLPAQPQPDDAPLNSSTTTAADTSTKTAHIDDGLPPGTIHACHRPDPLIAKARKSRAIQ
ncbi:MAG: hypothetical protein WBW53_18675 [Terriglobales bacterium]